MMSYTGTPRSRHVRAELLLAVISAVLIVLLVPEWRPASAQTLPDPVARAWGINSFGQLGDGTRRG